MKQALFILAAFILLAPSISSGQDFEVVSPPEKEIYRVICSNYKDSLVEILNSSDKDIIIEAEVLNTDKIHLSKSVWLVPQKTKTKLLLTVSANSFLNDTVKGKLRLFTKTHSDTVNLSLTNTNSFVIGGGCQVRSIAYADVPVGDTVRQVLYAINNIGTPVKCSPFGYEINNDKFVEFIRPLFDTTKEVETGKYFAFCEVLFLPKQPNVSRGGYEMCVYFKNNTNRGGQLCVYIDYLRSVRDPDLFNECFTVNEVPLYNTSLIEGGRRNVILSVKNNRLSNKLLQIDSINFTEVPNRSYLVVESSLENTTIPFLSKEEFNIPVSVTANIYSDINPCYMSYSFRSVNDDSCDKSFDGSIGIRVVLPTADSITFPINDNPYRDVLAMKSSASMFQHTFHFQNTTKSDLTIGDISVIGDMPTFSVQSPVSFPVAVASGDKLNVIIKYQGNVDTTAIDSLRIIATSGDTTYYEIQGLRTTTSGVQGSSDSSITVTLNPNPATTSVTVSVKGAGLIEEAEMNNAIGDMVLFNSRPVKPEWTWDVNPNFFTRGVYFVRVRGNTPEGKPFVVTKRLVVQ
ncbi:MAG TPA: hypothetical protein VIX80_01260 [Candidatus Kapabacteria bacterium]